MSEQEGKNSDISLPQGHSDTGEELDIGARTRILTSKGREYQIDLKEKGFRSSLSAWRAHTNKLHVLLSDSDNMQTLRTHRDILQASFDELSSVFLELQGLKEDVSEETSKFETTEINHQQLMQYVAERIREIESQQLEGRSNRSSHSNKSHLSGRSNVSHVSDTVIRKAKLKAELRYMDAELRCKAELEKIKVDKRKEVAIAELDALEEIECNPDKEDSWLNGLAPEVVKREYVNDFVERHNSTILESKTSAVNPVVTTMPSFTMPNNTSSYQLTGTDSLTQKYLNPLVTPFVPNLNEVSNPSVGIQTIQTKPAIYNDPEHSNEKEIANLAKVLADQVSLSRLPPPEPTIFYGDPIQFPAWKAAFNTLIDKRNLPDGEKIHYLKKYLGGPVKQVVENYFLLSTEDAYDDARKLLDERYGDPFVIASAFRDKLESWPKIMSKDASGLLKFSDFMKQCLTAMNSVPSLSVLNDCRENRKLLSKLPDWLIGRWNRIAATSQEEHKVFPSFKEFVNFVSKEARIASDPVTSVFSVKGNLSSPCDRGIKLPSKEKQSQGRSYLSNTQDINRSSGSFPNISCPFCHGPHNIDVCSSFLKKSVVDRKTFIKQKRLCFGCLKGGHVSKMCRKRKTCNVCSKSHPTLLHGDVKREDSQREGGSESTKSSDKVDTNKSAPKPISHSGVAFLSNVCQSSTCSMILPVFISHCDNPERELLVYALLDTQSDTTFMLDSTREALGLSGVDVKLSLSTLHAENKTVCSKRVKGLQVRGYDNQMRISLPIAYTREIMPANRSHIPTPEHARCLNLECISDKLVPLMEAEIGLLIGYNCPQALVPRDIITTDGNGPYAQKTDLGWTVVGTIDSDCVENDSIGLSHHILCHEDPSTLSGCDNHKNTVIFSLRTKVKEVVSSDILRVLEHDFCDLGITGDKLSQEDKLFLSKLSENICFQNGHYEMPLPFKGKDPVLPNNKSMALKRLNSLRHRLERNATFRDHYFNFMRDLISNGYAESVPDSTDNANACLWFIPHHGVYHPQKLDKIRVVFDCSAVFEGHSLNMHLLQGPDLTNKQVGVLCRFRKEPIALMCDVEKMFHQFKVCETHRDYLRFLWWEDENLEKNPSEFRMTVHLFGATSSPGCANFGMKRMASDNEEQFGCEVAEFIRKDFYVDDGLKSVSSVEQAVNLVEKSIELCSKAGLRLHKFVSNSKDVINALPPSLRAKNLENVDVIGDNLPIHRTLGVLWCLDSDTFQFDIVPNNRPLTRRGILSIVSTIYDPLGMISPIVLKGKQILQHMCADQLDWDDPLPEGLSSKWVNWYSDLRNLPSLKVSRCVKPKNFGKIQVAEMHHFSDASTCGYGQCSYIRLVNENGQVHCSLLMGKSRVVPLKPITIPRLELAAAVLSVKISLFLKQELYYPNLKHFFWTDSEVVLGYICNEARRFHVFVANRVQQIKEHTSPDQWKFVTSGENPADIASRGVSVIDLSKDPLWFRGPEFLWKPEVAAVNTQFLVCPDDPELKSVKNLLVSATIPIYSSLLERILYFSDWYRCKRAVALALRYKTKLMQKIGLQNTSVQTFSAMNGALTVEELRVAEIEIFKVVQYSDFKEEFDTLKTHSMVGIPSDRAEKSLRTKSLKGKSSLCSLDPFIDSNGLIRVGGRVRHSEMSELIKFPVVLPRKGHITELVIRYYHDKVQHQGRGMTTNILRANGLWILGCSSAVTCVISKCVLCRKLRGMVQGQKMADLPPDRLEPAPPFTFCAVDYFGPFYIKEGRKELKRYGVLFTCLACRAVHVETATSLETDSFINCLRRFIAIRGSIRQLRSDRGSNFIGAENELKAALAELDNNKVKDFLLQENCDWFGWKMNVPAASHMGGVWERQIRSIRNVMTTLLHTHGTQLDDDSLRTFFYEAGSIVNSRPLTVTDVNDPLSVTPLTPNHLLTMKTSIILPPPGNFQKNDVYCRRRWRRTQYLLNEFWSRWRNEYFQNLQVRNKWTSVKRNMSVGDIVLIKDDNSFRSDWRLGRVHEVLKEPDGLVRKVRIAIGTPSLTAKGKRNGPVTYMERPIHKLILIKETEEIPVEEPEVQ